MSKKVIIIAVVVLVAAGAGFWFWRRRKGGPTNGAKVTEAKKLPPVKSPPGIAAPAYEKILSPPPPVYTPPAPKPSVTSKITNFASNVAGTAATKACQASGGGPLCAGVGKVAALGTKLGTTVTVGTAKALGKGTVAVAKKLKFW